MSKSYREGKTYNYPMIEEEICFYSGRKELNQLKQRILSRMPIGVMSIRSLFTINTVAIKFIKVLIYGVPMNNYWI